MRKVTLEEWIEKTPKRRRKKLPKTRPTPNWKLSDSIKYIKRRDKYLQEEGILVKIGERKWRLKV